MSNWSLIPVKLPKRYTGCLVALSARSFRSRDIDLMDFCFFFSFCGWLLLGIIGLSAIGLLSL